MSVLKPVHISNEEEIPVGSDSPLVTCDICGKTGLSHRMINLIIFVGSPGHESLAPFQCPGSKQIDGRNEHWACSIECWKNLAHACVDEHVSVLLQEFHSLVKTKP